MENLTAQDIIVFLEKNEIEFKATQARLCLPIINRLYRKMNHGLMFEGIKITEDLIIDGHHRFLASLLADVKLVKTLSSRSSSTVIIPWTELEFDEADWDTSSKIKMLNEADAKFNNMEISEIEALIQ